MKHLVKIFNQSFWLLSASRRFISKICIQYNQREDVRVGLQ